MSRSSTKDKFIFRKQSFFQLFPDLSPNTIIFFSEHASLASCDKANLIWDVADLLRGDYKQSDYGKVILPITVLRRLDCVLAPTKQKSWTFCPKLRTCPRVRKM